MIFATNASPNGQPKLSQTPPPRVVWKAPGVVGKSYDLVEPATYALPAASMAMAEPSSDPVSVVVPPLPPRYEE